MDLNLFGKLGEVFRLMFSSFLSIELMLICILIFIILILNTVYDNKLYKIIFSVLLTYSFIVIVLSGNKYFLYCLRELLKNLVKVLIFPSTVMYFTSIMLVLLLLLYSILTRKLTKFKKIFNYSFFIFILFLFYSFVFLAMTYNINLLDKRTIYDSDMLLSVVQTSNFILIFCGFFKKKFD